MHPPASLCREVARLHPRLRIAWHGKERSHEDELNAGNFALVQLYHISDAGTWDMPATFEQFWENPWEYYGPIFNKEGGTTRDWDPLFYVPIYKARLDQFGISKEEINSGKVLKKIQEWLTPIKKRLVDSAKARGRDLINRTEALGAEMADYNWHLANQPGETSPLTTKEERIAAMKQLEKTKKESYEYMENLHMGA